MNPRSSTPTTKRCAIAIALVAALAASIASWRSGASATPPTPAPLEAAETTEPVSDLPKTARIVFTTVPAVNATVTWGSKRLGTIAPGQPLVIVRPRDSGPLDVVVRAQGYLPVHTRAHTFDDTKLSVKLTAPDETYTLLGYRAPIDAGTPTTDGGVSPALSAMPSSLTYTPPAADAGTKATP
jgi:hypothetical protein